MNLKKLLSLVLIASMLLTGTALMEEESDAEVPAVVGEIVEEAVEAPAGEAVEEIPEEAVEEIPEEPVEEVVEAVASEAVEAAVEEAADVELAEDVELEAEGVEEVLMEEEAVSEEPAAQAEEPAQQVVVEENDASAKLMEGENLIPIDEAHFPDAAFRQYISENIDGRSGAHDGVLSNGEIAATVTMSIDNKGAVNLTGIKYFTSLQKLSIVENNVVGKTFVGLTALDVSGMPNLASLNCKWLPIAALDFSNCPNLVEVDCWNDQLTSLAIAGCPKLERLECQSNKLTSLVFADNCPNLKKLCCNANSLSVLDLSNQSQFVARWKSWKYKSKDKKTTWYGIRRANSPEEFIHDNKTKVKTSGGSTNPAVPAGFADVPGAVAAQVTVAAGSTAKNTRATVIAAPGSKTQLDLGGATGKKFKSSNKKVAKVSKGGVVTFKKSGKVKITYKVGKKTRKVTLTVTDPTLPTAVAISEVNTAVKKGESVTLTPTVNEGANPGGFKWKSSNKKVATVKNGVVKFKKAGKVTITCTTKRGKKKASVTFAVSK